MANATYGVIQCHQELAPVEFQVVCQKAKKILENPDKLVKIRSHFGIPQSEPFLGLSAASYVEICEGAPKNYGIICLFEKTLCYFETLPPSSIILEAFVDLKKHKKWKRFHIVLDDQVLSCYQDRKGFKLVFSIHLVDIHSVLKTTSKDNEHKNVLEILTSSYSLQINFETEEEQKKWETRLNEKVVGHRPPIKFFIPLTYVTNCSPLTDTTIFPHGICISTASEDFIFNWVFDDFFSLISEACNAVPKTPGIYEGPSSSDEEDETPHETPHHEQYKEKVTPSEENAFHKFFELPNTETLLEVHSCSMLRGYLSVGQLYLSRRYLCFRSVLSSNILVRYRDITEIEVEKKRSRMITQAISITIKDQDKLLFAFLRQRKSLVLRIKGYIEKDKKSSLRLLRSLSGIHDFSPADFSHQKQLSIKILLVGSRGDVQPMIAFSLGLKAVGHKVTIATHETHRSFVENYGILFAPLHGDPKVLMKISNSPIFSSEFWKDAIREFPEFMTQILQTAWEACKQDTDVIIQNPPTLAGLHIAEKLQVPLFVAFTFPWTPTTTFPHPFARTTYSMGPIFNYYSYVVMDEALWAFGLPGNSMMDRHNQFRRDVLKLKELPLSSGGISKFIRDQGVPTLYCWSPLILPKPKDWPENVHVCGYWFLDSKDYSPPQDLVDFLKEEPKPLYIGFGSVTITNPAQVMSSIIEALEFTNQRAVMIRGWGGLGEGVTSKRIFLTDNVPHDWLFPQLVAAIHHGGAGTVSAALRAGIPSLVVPFFADQFLWGDQMFKLGVGPEPIPIRNLNSKNLSASIQKMVTDQEMQDKASSLGSHIRSQDGVTRAVSLFHQELKKFPERSGVWSVTLFTGSDKSSKLSRRSSVFLSLYGSKSHTEEIEVSPRHGFFSTLLSSALRGSSVRFLITTPALGELEKIRIRYNDKGTLKHGFFLEKIEVVPPNSKETISLDCNFWLSSTQGDKRIEREVQVASPPAAPS